MLLEFENQGEVVEPEGYMKQNTLTLAEGWKTFSLSSVMTGFNIAARDNSQEADKINS